MATDFPAALRQLLDAGDPAARDTAWEGFVATYTPLLLAASRSLYHDRDGRMDTYAHVLEELRADECRRLRAYRPDGPGRFTTWLTVVARRLAVDFHRHLYGRARSDSDAAQTARTTRRRLVGLVGAEVEVEAVPSDDDAGAVVLASERASVMARALATLPPRDRLLVRLRFEDDVSVREIARLLGLPSIFHVYRQLNRVLAELRRALEGAGFRGEP